MDKCLKILIYIYLFIIIYTFSSCKRDNIIEGNDNLNEVIEPSSTLSPDPLPDTIDFDIEDSSSLSISNSSNNSSNIVNEGGNTLHTNSPSSEPENNIEINDENNFYHKIEQNGLVLVLVLVLVLALFISGYFYFKKTSKIVQ